MSISVRCFHELVQYGASKVLEREYGNLLMAQPENGYDVSLKIDLEALPQDKGTLCK